MVSLLDRSKRAGVAVTIVDLETQKKLCVITTDAGLKLLEFWPGSSRRTRGAGLSIQKKQDGSLVTNADFASNELLCTRIHALFPQDGILSEEEPRDPQLGSKERVWIIDPLDGTQSFIDGNDDFGVLLALAVKQELQFGLIHLPARAQLAVAVKGGGAILNGKPLRVSNSAQIGPHGLYVRHFKSAPSPLIFPRWLDASRAFLRVCSGELDAMVVRVRNHGEWDLAPAAILVQESGGRVTNERGKPLRFGKGKIEFKYFVASNGKVHDEVLDIVTQS